MAMASSLMKTLRIRYLNLATATVAARSLSSFANQICKHTAESVQDTHTRKESPMESKASTISRCFHTIKGDFNSGKPLDLSKCKPKQCIDDESDDDFFWDDSCAEYEDEFPEPRINKFGPIDDNILDKRHGRIITGNVEAPIPIMAAKFAISKLNKRKGKNLEFVKLVTVRKTMFSVDGIMYYLTIEASDKNFYQAKVLVKRSGEMKIYFMRLARFPPLTQS